MVLFDNSSFSVNKTLKKFVYNLPKIELTNLFDHHHVLLFRHIMKY